MSADKPGEEAVTLAGCIPHNYESYDIFSTDGKKNEARGKPPQTIDVFARAAKQHVELFALVFGREHAQERLEAISIFHQMREAQPDAFPLHFLCEVWGR